MKIKSKVGKYKRFIRNLRVEGKSKVSVQVAIFAAIYNIMPED